MYRLRYVFPIILILAFVLPTTLSAQKVETVDLLVASAIVRETYSANMTILAASYDVEKTCWTFGLEDGTNLCVNENSGEILLNDDTNNVEEILDPTVKLEGAIAIAIAIFPNSLISNINLEENDDMLVWDIELDDGIRSIDVNAITGAILFYGYEAQDNNNYLKNDAHSADHNCGNANSEK